MISVGCFEDSVSEFLENIDDKHPNRVLILDDENRFPFAARRREIRFAGTLRYGIQAPRQVELYGRSHSDLAVDANMPAGLLCKAVDHRKAETCALADRF